MGSGLKNAARDGSYIISWIILTAFMCNWLDTSFSKIKRNHSFCYLFSECAVTTPTPQCVVDQQLTFNSTQIENNSIQPNFSAQIGFGSQLKTCFVIFPLLLSMYFFKNGQKCKIILILIY